MIQAEVDELEAVYERYDDNFFQYNRYLNALDFDTRAKWLPVIKGAMLGNNLKDFLPKMDWNYEETTEFRLKDGTLIDTITTKGKYVEPPCGDIPNEVLLVCYHAKRLAPEVIDSQLEVSRQKAQEEFEQAKLEMLYGRDALSVIELFEVGL